MKLELFLAETNQTPAAFGGSLVPPVSDQTVRNWMRGKSVPNKNKMPEVYRLTHGMVTANDFAGVAL